MLAGEGLRAKILGAATNPIYLSKMPLHFDFRDRQSDKYSLSLMADGCLGAFGGPSNDSAKMG